MNKGFFKYLSYVFLGIGIIMIIWGAVSGHYITMLFGFLMSAFPAYRIYGELSYKKLQNKGNIDWKERYR